MCSTAICGRPANIPALHKNILANIPIPACIFLEFYEKSSSILSATSVPANGKNPVGI